MLAGYVPTLVDTNARISLRLHSIYPLFPVLQFISKLLSRTDSKLRFHHLVHHFGQILDDKMVTVE